MRKLYMGGLCSLLLLFIACISQAQITLTGNSYTETFDNVGTSLPNGWTVRKAASATALGTADTLRTTATAWNVTNAGFKNFASADGLAMGSTAVEQSTSTDRALGIRQTSAIGDPGAAFVLELNNTTGLSAF